MKNPLNKRFIRDLKSDFGKYAVIFLFLVMLISLISGYLVANKSLYKTYEESFERYNIEDGHFISKFKLDEEMRKSIESENKLKLHELFYNEIREGRINYRVYVKRDTINTECIMSGEFPQKPNEIAIDRKFAENTGVKIGDTLTLSQKELLVTGFIALSDYSALFYSNADMVHDTTHFSVAIMTKSGFDSLDEGNFNYCYAYKFDNKPSDINEEKKASDLLLDNLKNKVILASFMPQYENKAIKFTGNDMGNDKVMFTIYYYIVMVIITFIFAVTASSTIVKEAGPIGTLRASGYSRGELLRHYMVLPVLVTMVAAVIGNILGYTIVEKYMAGLYYNSYSLTSYEVLWNSEAFIDTTIIPIIIMLVVHIFVLWNKLRMKPLRFLRRDLSNISSKKSIRLSTIIPFLQRFRIKIILQNWANYLTLFLGIIFASHVVIFGMMFSGLMDEYAKSIESSTISTYQYILKMPIEIKEKSAEKYFVTTLKTEDKEYVKEDITVYGINKNSKYLKADLPKEKVLISKGMMDKYSLNIGDTISLKQPYGDEKYRFTIAGSYPYDAVLSVFMNTEYFKEVFDKDDEYAAGYFSNVELTELDKEMIATTITIDDLTKLSTQLKISLGDFFIMFKWFGVIMFLLLMYLLSKQIIEKNARSISMVKILGFSDYEIGSLYIIATSFVIIASLLISIPIVSLVLTNIFRRHVYKVMTGYLPLVIANRVYIRTIAMGIGTYILVSLIQLWKIRKIPKSEALKDME